MPVLKNAKHEAFCQAVAKGKTQEEAYAAAGYKPSRHHASRLATKGNVISRISEIKSRVAEKVEWGGVMSSAAWERYRRAEIKRTIRCAILCIGMAGAAFALCWLVSLSAA